MKYRFLKGAVAVAAVALAASLASAQVVTQLPVNVPSATMKDAGNGPMEIRMLTGQMALFTSQGTGTGGTPSNNSTALVLTTTPTTPPCVGCIITQVGAATVNALTTSLTVGSFNYLTIGITSAQTVSTGTTLSWGAACPATPNAGAALVQAAVGADLPLYTTARVCAYGATGPGAQYLPFQIGSH